MVSNGWVCDSDNWLFKAIALPKLPRFSILQDRRNRGSYFLFQNVDDFCLFFPINGVAEGILSQFQSNYATYEILLAPEERRVGGSDAICSIFPEVVLPIWLNADV